MGLAVAGGFPLGERPILSFAIACGILILLAAGAIAVGLASSAFMRTDAVAYNAGAVLAMLQVFLSGAFFPMPSPVWRGFAVFYVVPATHAMRALQRCFSDGCRDVAIPVTCMLVLVLLTVTLAVVLFRRQTRSGTGGRLFNG